MTTKADIDDFFKQQSLAVVGVSRTGKKFSNLVYKDLKKKGYRVYPVNPNLDQVDGDQCFRTLASISQPVDGAIAIVPPNQTAKVVRDAAAAGIKSIWIQQGAESKEAIYYCKENGIKVIHNQCILMFAEPAAFPHRLHRYLWQALGKVPK